MRYESAGALKGGRQVWALARMPSVDHVADDDTLDRYVLWLNSHDGPGRILPSRLPFVWFVPTPPPWPSEGKRESATWRYRRQIETGPCHCCRRRMSSSRPTRPRPEILAARRYSQEQANEYVTTLVPEAGRRRPFGNRSGNARSKQFARRFRADRNQLPSIKGTWWSLYNASVKPLTTASSIRSGATGRKTEWRPCLWGRGADFKQRAFDLALAMAG